MNKEAYFINVKNPTVHGCKLKQFLTHFTLICVDVNS